MTTTREQRADAWDSLESGLEMLRSALEGEAAAATQEALGVVRELRQACEAREAELVEALEGYISLDGGQRLKGARLKARAVLAAAKGGRRHG